MFELWIKFPIDTDSSMVQVVAWHRIADKSLSAAMTNNIHDATWRLVGFIHCGSIKASFSWYHDNVIKWKHFLCYWAVVRGIHRSPVNSSHKGQWQGALMFSLICAWINGWVNSREAGDLICHRAQYDVTLMCQPRILMPRKYYTELNSVSNIICALFHFIWLCWGYDISPLYIRIFYSYSLGSLPCFWSSLLIA